MIYLNDLTEVKDELAQKNYYDELQLIQTSREELPDDIRKSLAKFALTSTLVNSEIPKKSQEFMQCVQATFGVTPPYTTSSEELTSPFEYLYNVFTGKEGWNKVLAWASRDSSKTYTFFMLHYLLGTFYPGHEGLHAGGVVRQAEVVSKSLIDIGGRKETGAVFLGLPRKKFAEWKNGSTWMISPGTFKSIDGQHPNSLTMDEIKHWPIDAIDQCWGVPSSKNDCGKRLLFGSTNQNAGGAFNYVLDNLDAKDITLAKWTIFEVMQPCITCMAEDAHPFYAGPSTDDKREEVCPLWYECQGVKARNATGWKPLAEVQDFVKSLGGGRDQKALTQAFCKTPDTTGAVFANYLDEDYRSEHKGSLVSKLGYDPSKEYYIFCDPPEGKKAAMLFVQFYPASFETGRDIVVVFDELILEICADDGTMKVALYDYIEKNSYPDPKNIIVDPRRTNAVATLTAGRLTGAKLSKSYKAETSSLLAVEGGKEIIPSVNEVNEWFEDGEHIRRIFVNKKCVKTRAAFKGWLYKGKGGFSELFKDECDAMRYGIRFVKVKLATDRKYTGIRVI